MLVTSHLREIRATLCFQHGSRSTEPIWPVVGLRQGCSLSSMVMATLRQSWIDRGCGLSIAERRLLYLAWADDTWLVAKSPAESNAMVQELRTAVR